MQIAARPLPQPVEMRRAGPQILANRRALGGIVGDELLERSRQRADTPAQPLGGDLAEQVEEEIRVVEPLPRGPVGRVDALFYPRVVKLSVGKTIDGKNVAAVL